MYTEQGPIKDQLDAATVILKRGNVPNPRWHAELLLGSVLGLARHELYVQATRSISSEHVSRFQSLVTRRAHGEPTQYLIGQTEFYGLEFRCDSRALIPRPETEHVVEAVLWLVGEHQGQGLKILELGTGCGCISIALARNLTQASIVATDIKADALELAEENALRHHVENRIEFRRSDLFADVVDDYNVIVANLPYVSSLDEDRLQVEIRDWEPRDALFAGPDGLSVLREVLNRAHRHLASGGHLVLEVGLGQDQAMETMAGEAGAYSAPEWRNDYQGIRRVFCVHKL
jgi:release factor glutamine methyltransferase